MTRGILLAGVSVVAMAAASLPARAGGPIGMWSPSSAPNIAAAAMSAATAGVQQAQQATQQSRNSLAAAAQAIQSMQAAQAAARSAAAALSGGVPNGLVPRGLVVAPNAASDPAVWQGANLPTQSTSGTQTNVTVQQTAQKAILTWSSFNIGVNTQLYFDQSAGNQTNGNNNWIALNRVLDPSGQPSQILGQIKAEGSVYVINQNGIIFGGTSQIDVHTLIASSLSFLGEGVTSSMVPGSAQYDNAVQATNSLFLNSVGGGIAAAEATGSGGGNPNLVLGLGTVASSYVPSGAITVEAGASIATHANGTQNDGGFVLLAAPAVTNAGTITATDGQVILAAGIGVSLVPQPGSTQFLVPELTGRINVGGLDQTPAGILVNSGLVQAVTGNVTLLGTNTRLGGVIGVTTSISRPGSITISTVDEGDVRDGATNSPTSTTTEVDRRAGQLVVSGLIANLPEEDGQTVPSDGGSFTAGKIGITAGAVWLQSGALIEAPGASVGLTALSVANPAPGESLVQSRIYVDNGATIDVAGLSDVQLPISDILVTIPLVGQNELANAPLLRNSVLSGLANVVIDSTLSGTTADGLVWVGSPILNASGYVDLIPQKIDQVLTNAGSITLSGGQVMTATGSLLNLDGGFVHYLGGTINTTKVVDAYGRVVGIGSADPNVPIVGVAGQFTLDHAHWKVSETYVSALFSGYYEPDYIVGGNAGTLSVFGAQATVLDGTMLAQAFAGLKQIEAGLAPSGTSPGGNFLPQGGSFILGAAHRSTEGVGDFLNGGIGSVIVQNEAPQLADLGIGATTPLDTGVLTALGPNDPNNILAWTSLPAAALTSGGFANVTVMLDRIQGRGIAVAAGTTLAVQPGGSITFKSNQSIDVEGSLSAPSGTIALSSLIGGITLGSSATINVAGQWVNDSNQAGIAVNAAGDATFINGGRVTLATSDTASAGVDATGSIILQAGSLIDLSSGGVLLPNGLLAKNGVPQGKGGSLSLLTYYNPSTGQFGDLPDGGASLPATQPTAGRIVMDGTIESAGFAGGGTLALQALGFQIGGDPSLAAAWDLYLPTSFFATQGFGNYQLNAIYDATVAPGAIVRLTQQNLIPNLSALRQAPSGADLNAGGLTTLGTIDPYHRQATGLVITAGADLRWSTLFGTQPQYDGVANAVTIGAGAAIQADAGAAIGLGSPAQVTVLGSIFAPGGSITLSAESGATGDGFAQAGQAAVGYTSSGKSVWLGPNAVLDVSGVTLTDPSVAPVQIAGAGLGLPTTGKVLAGGAVALASDTGAVVMQAGSVIDVSGASATLDLPQSASGATYAPQPVWSNAGSLTLAAAAGLYVDGTIKAQPGAAAGRGGTLTILPEVPGGASQSAQAILLQQSGSLLPAGLLPGQSLPNLGNTLVFSVDELAGSGISTLVIGNAATPKSLVPVAVAGSLTLALDDAVIINTPQLVALAAGTTVFTPPGDGTGSLGAPMVSISAPYVEIAGPGGGPNSNITAPTLPTPAALSDATLIIQAQFIDLGNQVSLANFGQASFVSAGDIRLSSTAVSPTNSAALAPGILYSPGNLTFQAADLYPASGEAFIIAASGPQPTTISFLGNGSSQVPLSAGGTLLVDATNILQAGTIRAPSGTIVLGVGNAGDAATQAQFANLPLSNTQSVTLAAGSVTSVSLDGTTLPYGTTTDGKDWQYNTIASNASPADLAAPPAKSITVNGTNVALDHGATIDLSGGGNLQAIEWVQGTGGTRNLLAQYNVTYPASGAAVATPLYSDARNVYAIVPSYEAPVAAYDPVYAQSTQPANGGAGTQTLTSGVGQAALGAQVGQAVYLSGVPGLPAGTYVLLPAKYATLPGAYRVVENTGASTVAPGQSVTMPDGTYLVSGYYVDALSGAHSAVPSQFQVQSAAAWGQYSQYTLTGANSYFTSEAQSSGSQPPSLPMDAGRLVLAATSNLVLDTTLKAAAALGGAPSQVDIASQDIQITGAAALPLAGYLQISAESLDALGAGSLLIGGTRTATASGITIDAIANSVVVSNDAGTPLTGPEIILVTKTDASGADPNAATGLTVAAGSVIIAKGAIAASADTPITIGSSALSGDGALLMVTNGGLVSVTRNNLPATSHASLSVGPGAVIDGGQALVLDSSGALAFDPSASFTATNIAIDAAAISLTNATGAAAAALPGFVIGQSGLAQFANAQTVALRSFSTIGFVGTLDLAFGQSVVLSAGGFTSDGNAVSLTASTIAFTNDLGASVPAASLGTGSLNVNAAEIDLGAGSKVLSGFGTVTMTARNGILGQGTGTLDLGAANATLSAPVYLADTSSASKLTTTGTLVLDNLAGTALARNAVGGAIGFTAGTLDDNGARIAAPAGNVTLEATAGDLTLAGGALVSAAGVAKQFFDVTEYAPAGNITLTADHGTIDLQPGATLDFSGAQGGGAAGGLTLSAPVQTVLLDGAIKGNAAPGYAGGSFSLTTGGAVDLDNLALELAQSGVTNAITVDAKAGNLVLSAGNTLTAHLVSLTADGGTGDATNGTIGNVVIYGTINAAGPAGGEIDLYGKNKVDVEGSLIATGSSPTQRGGTVNLGTSATFDPTIANPYNATYGYENLTTSGAITLGTAALIDVSGGTAGGLTGGTVNFRAPLLANGDVNVTLGAGAQIRGSRATTLEAFAVWSTTDATTGALHFDGIVDPAGWYQNSVAGAGAPGMVAGTWTDQSGNALPAPTSDQLATYLQNDYFTPTAANTDHQSFYGYLNGGSSQGAGTLMGFVENFPIIPAVTARFANVANFSARPGIELDNPDPTVNNGNISILTNWNLGSGSSQASLDFRVKTTGAAPIITFRADKDVEVKASLSDGFFQIENPISPGSVSKVFVPDQTNYSYLQQLYSATPVGNPSYVLANYGKNSSGPYANTVSGPTTLTAGDAQGIAEYYALYEAYAKFLLSPPTSGGNAGSSFMNAYWIWYQAQPLFGTAAAAPTPPTAQEQAKNPVSYLQYLQAYATYYYAATLKFERIQLPQAPITEAVAVIPAGTPAAGGSIVTIAISATADNTPSPIATAANPLPLLAASLAAGVSSSYRIVAGANIASADPLALQPAGSAGSLTLNGHTSYADANGQPIDAPAMIRTGSGSIDIAAASNITLADTSAPGVIYTAGVPALGAPQGSTASILASRGSSFASYDLLATNAVNPEAAGDISIHAQNDIIGVENVTGAAGVNLNGPGFGASQFWWQWMQTGNVVNGAGQVTQSSINFGAFDQGVMSVGGNVSISAGGNIVNLAVSLPTSWYKTDSTGASPAVTTVGGGNLTVTAGGSILSGDYFVANGTGTLTAGGLIGSSGLNYLVNSFTGQTVEVSTLLAVQNGVFNVSARQGVDIGGIFDPSYLQGAVLTTGYGVNADAQSYSATSALHVISTTGNVAFNTLTNLALLSAGAGPGNSQNDNSYVLPATVDLTAFSGGITVARDGELYPSATGELNLVADQSVNIFNGSSDSFNYFGLIDASASALPTPTNPIPQSMKGITNLFDGNLTSSAPIDHSQTPLHANDSQPVYIYSLDGSITDGLLGSDGRYASLLQIAVDKPAQIRAGLDILNLAFLGQNLRESDITSIIAGRDILDARNFAYSGNFIAPSLVLGGPGTFDIEAGRNIGPFLNQAQAFALETRAYAGSLGIDTVGNAVDPFLPHQSANVQVLFGIGPGIADEAFISAYVDPAVATSAVQQALVSFMEQYDAGQGIYTGLVKDRPQVSLTLAEAWAQFQALPQTAQQLFNEQVLFDVLTMVGKDYHDASSPYYQQYARGYQAINTLFPAAYGYTANSLAGGSNGANSLVETGNLDIRSTTIQTQQGGNVSILGPGGQALIGSSSAPPVIAASNGTIIVGPGAEGVLTLEQGNVNIFTDQSLLLAQSRVFTEQGGNMVIWSSNGDINAGKGAKTIADVPPPAYVSDNDHYNTVDARGEVTGAGIATLQTIPGAPAGSVYLLAPRGTVDAGDAGIRVSGNLVIAALQVLNANNIQVQGTSFGVPTPPQANLLALTNANNQTGAATQHTAAPEAGDKELQPSIIVVEVLGYGGGDATEAPDNGQEKRKPQRPEKQSYDAGSQLQVVGLGELTEQQKSELADMAASEPGASH